MSPHLEQGLACREHAVSGEGGREQRGGAPEPYSEPVGRAATILPGVCKATTAHGG